MTTLDQPLFIPVILGTPRQGRKSEYVARFLLAQVQACEGVDTGLIDIRTLTIPADDEGDPVKDPAFSAICERADGFILVAPEYNHSFSGILKHVLDSNLKEYIHKAVGICGVSAGPFGGTRVIQSLLPVMRELGLTTTFTDLNFGSVSKQFDELGQILDGDTWSRRFQTFMDELVWMSTVLRYGRCQVSLISKPAGESQVHHADKPCPQFAAKAGQEEMVIEVKTTALV